MWFFECVVMCGVVCVDDWCLMMVFCVIVCVCGCCVFVVCVCVCFLKIGCIV